MLSVKSYFQSIRVCTLTAIAIGLSSASQLTLAQSIPSPETLQETLIIFNDPTPPSQGSPTGRQRGGASRGECRKFEGLTALVPDNNSIVWGQTTSDRPTFWFYLPSPLTAQTPIEFVVQDEDDNYIYKTHFTAPETRSGLIDIQIPETIPSLEVGKTYSWTFTVYCDPTPRSDSIFVQGAIQRISLDAELQNRLEEADSIDRASLYAANGIWFEALNTLANRDRTNTDENSIKAAWDDLLEQANLDSLTEVPFSPCCTAEQQIGDRE